METEFKTRLAGIVGMIFSFLVLFLQFVVPFS